jgi:hypothetical protein
VPPPPDGSREVYRSPRSGDLAGIDERCIVSCCPLPWTVSRAGFDNQETRGARSEAPVTREDVTVTWRPVRESGAGLRVLAKGNESALPHIALSRCLRPSPRPSRPRSSRSVGPQRGKTCSSSPPSAAAVSRGDPFRGDVSPQRELPIALRVLGCSADFDPAADPTLREEMTRLGAKLGRCDASAAAISLSIRGKADHLQDGIGALVTGAGALGAVAELALFELHPALALLAGG